MKSQNQEKEKIIKTVKVENENMVYEEIDAENVEVVLFVIMVDEKVLAKNV